MIYGKIANLPIWGEKVPSIEYALNEAKRVADGEFTIGKTEIDGAALYASSSEYLSAGREGKIFENHHAYIDVQMMIEGEEQIDVIIPEEQPECDYSEENDVEFESFDKGYSTITLRAGDFLLLLPGEWHRPGVGDGAKCRKTVVKIRK